MATSTPNSSNTAVLKDYATSALATVDPNMTFTILQSMRLDFGAGSQVHP